MIVFIEGFVRAIETNTITLLVQGIGYEIWLSKPSIETLRLNDEVQLYIYHHFGKEGEQQLFGFTNQANLAFYKLLLTVHGIGPKTALNIMDKPLSTLIEGIANKQPHLLKVTGVGPKILQRIILELQPKMSPLNYTIGVSTAPKTNPVAVAKDEVYTALTGLGFSKANIDKAYGKSEALITPEMDTQAVLKIILKNIKT